MNLLTWLQQHYPVDALPYEIGFLLLAVSMIWYSRVLKKMVAILHERPIWILPLLGAVCILVSVGMHVMAYLVFLPKMDALTTVAEINRASAFMMQWRTGSLASIMLGGLCSLLGGGIYYRWTTR
jgi:hypothetical protein